MLGVLSAQVFVNHRGSRTLLMVVVWLPGHSLTPGVGKQWHGAYPQIFLFAMPQWKPTPWALYCVYRALCDRCTQVETEIAVCNCKLGRLRNVCSRDFAHVRPQDQSVSYHHGIRGGCRLTPLLCLLSFVGSLLHKTMGHPRKKLYTESTQKKT